MMYGAPIVPEPEPLKALTIKRLEPATNESIRVAATMKHEANFVLLILIPT
ncbi:hypothetical protein KAX03_02705 [Candidatus Bathyarchaeota archaeon]|nr:hypothetical protein [Candidatus Bathyarchaeota archaeon]